MTRECDFLKALDGLGVAPRCEDLCVDARACGGGTTTWIAQTELPGVTLDRYSGMLRSEPAVRPAQGGPWRGHLRFARSMLRFAHGALRALAKMWAKARIVHRNISGKNFLVHSDTGPLDVKLIDFDTSLFVDKCAAFQPHCVASHLLPPRPWNEHSQPVTWDIAPARRDSAEDFSRLNALLA